MQMHKHIHTPIATPILIHIHMPYTYTPRRVRTTACSTEQAHLPKAARLFALDAQHLACCAWRALTVGVCMYIYTYTCICKHMYIHRWVRAERGACACMRGNDRCVDIRDVCVCVNDALSKSSHCSRRDAHVGAFTICAFLIYLIYDTERWKPTRKRSALQELSAGGSTRLKVGLHLLRKTVKYVKYVYTYAYIHYICIITHTHTHTQTETESSRPEADPRVYDFSSATARRCMIQEKTAFLDAAMCTYVSGCCCHGNDFEKRAGTFFQ